VAQALQEFPLRAVVASPQRRAQETAEPIARLHGLSIRTEPGLDEVWLGRWQGKTWDELQGDEDLRRYMRDPTYTCDAIEAAAAVQERILATAERLRSEAGEGAVLLVSHGDPIKLLFAHYLSMVLSAYRRLAISTGSVSLLRFSPLYGSRVVVLNWKPPGALRQLVACATP
jgi:broad specificity phosphatase PhoE